MLSSAHSISPSPIPKLKTKEAAEEDEGTQRIVNKYKEKVSTLPKKKCWGSYLYNYQGFWYFSTYGCSVEGVMASQDSFQANPTDVVLATNPKCGTTWLKALAFAIVNRNKYKNESVHPLLVGNPHDYVPFIEIQLIFRENLKPKHIETTDPQLLATHMPYTALPESVHASDCRVVYICREPKDVFISRWFFMKKLEHRMPEKGMTFDEAFELFCQGISPVGSYWDHVLGYYKASLEHPDKVLFLKYEEMKKDTIGNVKRLAEFLGRPFTAEEEAEGVVEEIIELCSFNKMKNLEVNKIGLHRDVARNDMFFREGKVGDFVNHLTPEMVESINKVTEQKFRGYELLF